MQPTVLGDYVTGTIWARVIRVKYALILKMYWYNMVKSLLLDNWYFVICHLNYSTVFVT